MLACLLSLALWVKAAKDYTQYVNPMMGTESTFELSTGNTYPVIAMPWGMNFWTPQTGKMGDGWQYMYTATKIRGFKQTHQPSPWINDFGQFSLMPVVGNRNLMRTNVPAGSLIKERKHIRIIIRYIWPIMI